MAETHQQIYFELFNTALRTTFRMDQSIEQWGETARMQAEKLMGFAQLKTVAPQAPTMPAVMPEAAQAGNRFGPAFLGWDEAALTQCLVGIQSVVMCMEWNGTPEQLAVEKGNLDAAIKKLFDARIEQKLKAAKEKAG